MRFVMMTALAGGLLVAASAVGLAQGAGAPDGIKVTGGMLTDAKGMALYTFDKDDQPNQSVCHAACVKNWLPLPAGADAAPAGDWTPIVRDDGVRQWAYKGKPLYTFAKDAKPGDMGGDGFGGGVWHTAKP